MVKTEMYPIERKMTDDDLNRLIESLERSECVTQFQDLFNMGRS
jgi:hypothetical protein